MSNYNNSGNLPAGPTEITNTSSEPERVYTREEVQQAWDQIREASKPAIKATYRIWDNMRHNRPLMNAIGHS